MLLFEKFPEASISLEARFLPVCQRDGCGVNTKGGAKQGSATIFEH